MEDGNAPYEVSELTVRETPTLTAGGRTAMQTRVSFRVGQHGPFALLYAGKANAAQITQDVTAKVNELKALDQAVSDLNRQSS